MPVNLTDYRIFIASPGGLGAERATFRDTIRRYNEDEAIPRKVYFEAVGWENTLGGVGRPQSIINEDIIRCDYLILVLWDRWGSSPDDADGKYTSAVEEEFQLAIKCLEDEAFPMRKIVVLFKGVAPAQLSDPGEQLKAVLAFKTDLERRKAHLYHTFDTEGGFQEIFCRHLGQWCRDHRSEVVQTLLVAHPLPDLGLSESLMLESERGDWQDGTEDPNLIEAWELANEGCLSEAEVAFSRAVVGKDSVTGLLHYGRFLVRVGRLDRARTMFKRALETSEREGCKVEMARSYLNLGTVELTQGNSTRAEEMFRSALKIDEAIGRPKGTADDYQKLGLVLVEKGDMPGAEKMYRKSIEISKKLGWEEGVANALQHLGVLLHICGDNEQAEIVSRKALAINTELDRREGMARAYGNLGLVLLAKSDPYSAEGMHRKSLEIEESLGCLEGMARAYGNLGVVFMAKGDPDGAEQMYRKSLEIEINLGHLVGMANDYTNLSQILMVRGDMVGSEEMLRMALGINTRLGRLQGLANCYANLGILFSKKDESDVARDMLLKSLEAWLKLDAVEEVEQVKELLKSLA